MSNIIQILRRMEVQDQAILLPMDDFSNGGTAIDKRRGNQDNQTWGNATGRSKTATRNLGYYYVNQDGTQNDYNIDADASLEGRFDPDEGAISMRAKISSSTWGDGLNHHCFWAFSDGDLQLRILKRSSNVLRIQRQNSAPDSTFKNIDGAYSNTNWFWFSATWNVGADIMKLRANGDNLGTASGLLANTDTINNVAIGNATGTFEPWIGDLQMFFMLDGQVLANPEMDWLARYNEV